MKRFRIVAAVLLALPLLVFGGSFFIHPFPLPQDGWIAFRFCSS